MSENIGKPLFNTNCHLRSLKSVLTPQFQDGHVNWVRALVFHPNGQLLLSACDDKTIRIWDLKTGRCTKTIEAHDHFVTSLAWGRADAGEGRRVNVCASGSVDQRIKVWMP